MVMHRVKPRFLRSWLRKVWMVANIDSLFYPLTFYSVYLTFGPWFVGEIVQGQTGVVFSWGTFLGDKFLPGSMSYCYGFLHTLTFNLPLVFIIGNTADCRLISTYLKFDSYGFDLIHLFENLVTSLCLRKDRRSITLGEIAGSICLLSCFLQSSWLV